MISEAMKAEGWIEHDGGPCPVPLDSRPGVMTKDGWILEPGIGIAEGWVVGIDVWQRQGKFTGFHIIAYKPEATHD